jgi:hypothetical protein
VAGPLTLMQLNRLAGVAEPVLASATAASSTLSGR